MGSDLVKSFPDERETEGGEGQHGGSAALVKYTDTFEKLFPYYLSIGMTYDQFWHGDCWLAKSYREAFEIKQDRENLMLWLQGRYIYDALCEAAPLYRFSMKGGKVEALPYNKEPYPRTEKQAREIQMREEKKKMEKIRADLEVKAMEFNKNFYEKQNEEIKEVSEDAE